MVNNATEAGKPVYQQIVQSNFLDTYREVQKQQGVSVYCQGVFDQGCRVGVLDVQDPFYCDRSENRTDFVFARSQGSQPFSILDSSVLFNPLSVAAPNQSRATS